MKKPTITKPGPVPGTLNIKNNGHPATSTFCTRLDGLQLGVLHPDVEGELPPEAIQLLFKSGGSSAMLYYSLGTPQEAVDLIESLIALRRHVWADAPPVDPDARIKIVEVKE